jgi:uncharacterized membrane protein
MLPTHIEKTAEAIAELHMQHHREATPFQHAVDRMTNVVGRPRTIGFLTLCVAIWIGVNLLLRLSGRAALDPPPFQWLQDAGTLLSLYITILILITQRREDELAGRRDQMTLELAMLGDQKTAKIIELLEELRRDHPEIADRVDREAAEMSRPSPPGTVLDEIKGRPEQMPAPPGKDA